MEIRKILEYGEFFVNEDPIDVHETLRHFDRDTLVRMATILSLHYGNLHIPDDQHTLFSEVSNKHLPYLNNLFEIYYNRHRIKENQIIQVSTFRTALELWRIIFSIPQEECRLTIAECDIELVLFKVILTLNEYVIKFEGQIEQFQPDEFIFLNFYLNNETNNFDFKLALQAQIYYFSKLVDFIPNNKVLEQASKTLFSHWGINSWKQYFATILHIANLTNKYKIEQQRGLPVIDLSKIPDKTGLFSSSLIKALSIEKSAYIPFEPNDNPYNRELNIDYRRFRSQPFVHLQDDEYVVINNQLLCERLFNSLSFDFSPLINGKVDSCGFFDYNKTFIEKQLFRDTFHKCLPAGVYTFPQKKYLEEPETPNEPDFYVRYKKGELIIAECKAIKMNGVCRDDGDYLRLLEELREKIVIKTRNLDKARKPYQRVPEPIGIGQLINHIENIENDSFRWDRSLPDSVAYYPLLVLEDVRFLVPGFLSMINRWFYEELQKRGIDTRKVACLPVMALSIDTLFLYDSLIAHQHLTRLIESFLSTNANFDSENGIYCIHPHADFDDFLRQNAYNKSSFAERWIKQFLSDK